MFEQPRWFGCALRTCNVIELIIFSICLFQDDKDALQQQKPIPEKKKYIHDPTSKLFTLIGNLFLVYPIKTCITIAGSNSDRGSLIVMHGFWFAFYLSIPCQFLLF